jgi:recombination protein RecR
VAALPEPLQAVVDQLTQLPGVGPKSALRMALILLKWPREKALGLAGSIERLRNDLTLCGSCQSLADSDPCRICSDPGRSEDQLCLVSEWDSLIVMEEAGFYRGRYFVLGGLLSPLDGVDAGSLAVERLLERIEGGQIKEVVLALGTTHEAEVTGSYLKNLLARRNPAVQVTRLAQGIPLGSELKFVDRETLRQSLVYRQQF